MSTESFDRVTFEAALPAGQWYDIEEFSEYSYAIPVADSGTEILICSSIRRGESVCGATGKNSIRHWLVDAKTRKPVAPKLKEWTARTVNWRKNMLDTLRELYKIGLCLGSCKACSGRHILFTVKKDGPNKGRQFIRCSGETCKYFQWLDEVIK